MTHVNSSKTQTHISDSSIPDIECASKLCPFDQHLDSIRVEGSIEDTGGVVLLILLPQEYLLVRFKNNDFSVVNALGAVRVVVFEIFRLFIILEADLEC